MNKNANRVNGPVHIMGTGLLGASIGMGLRDRDIEVTLEDASPTALALAADYGAGVPRVSTDPEPKLVVVATPPDVTADVVERALRTFPNSVVTDVASVKLAPFQELTRRGLDLEKYIGSHPMAGRERGGAVMARTDLFVGRPWVICRDHETASVDLAQIDALALDLGAVPIEMTPEEHDASVGLVSHVPQVVASALAARLRGATEAAMGLAGQGLRDATRIASSDPELWVQILAANTQAIVPQLEGLRDDLGEFVEALKRSDEPGSKRKIANLMAAGNAGVSRIPGKPGTDARFTTLTVIIDDRPGQLARMLTDLGDLGVNMEDLKLEHSPGAQIGFAQIAVLPEVAQSTMSGLSERGWRTL